MDDRRYKLRDPLKLTQMEAAIINGQLLEMHWEKAVQRQQLLLWFILLVRDTRHWLI